MLSTVHRTKHNRKEQILSLYDLHLQFYEFFYFITPRNKVQQLRTCHKWAARPRKLHTTHLCKSCYPNRGTLLPCRYFWQAIHL